MKIRFLGANGTVTGSRHLVSVGESGVLLDCGLFQGWKQLRLRNWAPMPIDVHGLDAVVLSHAHIDHSGYLPVLVREGFRGKVFCTPATLELARILLADSAWLQEEQADDANRDGWSKHHPAQPLYTRRDVERALKHFKAVDFGHEFEPAPGVTARFDHAGHILGAAITTLQGDGHTLVFSGDLGREADPVMRPPERIAHADTLLLESTYGDRLHPASDPMAELGEIVSRTAARGGSVIVPAFAVGRTQSLLLLIDRLKAAGAIPAAMPVFLDSPLAIDATGIYMHHRGEHRIEATEFGRLGHAARFLRTPDESRAADASEVPAIIIAGSGMATGGRVLHHLKRFGPDPRSTILLAGFQAGGTRGAALANGARELKIHGAYVPVRAEVGNLQNLSAHADREELVVWLSGFQRPPRRIFLVHGEPGAADALRILIGERLGWEASVPEYRDEVGL